MSDEKAVPPSPGWPRVVIAFLFLFAVYQAAEGMQTIFAPLSPLGPALMLLAPLLAWPLGRWLGWRGYDAYGLDLRRSSLVVLIVGLLVAGLAKFASLEIGIEIGAYMPSAEVTPLTPILLPVVFLSSFVPSVAEDIITRGFLLRTIPVRLGFWVYVLASAALYTANHIWRFGWGPSEQLRLFCLGLAYAAAAWRWRTLWGAVALHWGWNFANGLAAVIMPAEVVNVVDARLVAAGAHLVLFAIIALLPLSAAAPPARPRP
ncbi:MAG TPA: CPBP family intramembrane glutamic endopeptidase [Sphingobium sp.]